MKKFYCFIFIGLMFLHCRKDSPKRKDCTPDNISYVKNNLDPNNLCKSFSFEPACTDSSTIVISSCIVDYTAIKLKCSGPDISSATWYSKSDVLLSQEGEMRLYDFGIIPIQLIVEGMNYCRDTFVFEINVPPPYVFWAPNAFTPNGDGINDTYSAVTIGLSNYEMSIYNRYWKLIFKTDNINSPWDGWKNKDLYSPGLYYAKFTFFAGAELIEKCVEIQLINDDYCPKDSRALVFRDMINPLSGPIYPSRDQAKCQ